MGYNVVARIMLEDDGQLDEGATFGSALLVFIKVFGRAAPYQIRDPL